MLFSWVFVGASLPHRCLLPNELPFPNETFQPLVQVFIFSHFARDLELLKGWKSQAGGLRADECRLTNISTGVHTECPHGWLYDRQMIRSSCEDFKISRFSLDHQSNKLFRSETSDSVVSDWNLVCSKWVFSSHIITYYEPRKPSLEIWHGKRKSKSLEQRTPH